MNLNTKIRFIIAIIYSIASYVVLGSVTGIWYIKAGNESAWLVTIVGYFIYELLSVFYFVKPQDTLATSISTILLLVTLDTEGVSNNSIIIKNIGLILSLVALLTSIINIYLNKQDVYPRINRITYVICQYIGSGKVLFFPVLLFCSIAYYNTNTVNYNAILWLNTFWVFVVLSQPLEVAFYLLNSHTKNSNLSLGKIIRIDNPNIVRIGLKEECSWMNNNYISKLADGKWIRIIPIAKQVQSDAILGTGIYCEFEEPIEKSLIKEISVGEIYQLDIKKTINEIVFNNETDDLEYVGYIIENSCINIVKIEVSTSIELEEGLILVIKQHNKKVYYQIIDGNTTEEIFQSNPKGKTIIKAYQLGMYTLEEGFRRYSWVPDMNTPVFLIKRENTEDVELSNNEIGFIPNTNIRINADFNDLVTYHCAILGVTGTGKTEFAFDIIRNNTYRNVKVICVDFTGDYKARLKDVSPTILGLNSLDCIELEKLIDDVETGAYGAPSEKKKFNSFLDKIKPNIIKQIDDYILSDTNLAIIELPEIATTRATLRITEMYLSNVFNWAKNNRNKKTIQIVLEEAHTIIPEKNMYTYDKVDTESVLSRLSQIALQGRKYGVGLMLISQRTALVSKTVLSQCNTFFTFNLIDKTSLEFLGNVYSNEHIESIKNLKKLQVLAFGKAVKSENPVIMEIPFDPSKKEASMKIGLEDEISNTENEME